MIAETNSHARITPLSMLDCEAAPKHGPLKLCGTEGNSERRCCMPHLLSLARARWVMGVAGRAAGIACGARATGDVASVRVSGLCREGRHSVAETRPGPSQSSATPRAALSRRPHSRLEGRSLGGPGRVLRARSVAPVAVVPCGRPLPRGALAPPRGVRVSVRSVGEARGGGRVWEGSSTSRVPEADVPARPGASPSTPQRGPACLRSVPCLARFMLASRSSNRACRVVLAGCGATTRKRSDLGCDAVMPCRQVALCCALLRRAESCG